MRPGNCKAFKRGKVGGHGAARMLPADIRKADQEWTRGMDGAWVRSLSLSSHTARKPQGLGHVVDLMNDHVVTSLCLPQFLEVLATEVRPTTARDV